MKPKLSVAVDEVDERYVKNFSENPTETTATNETKKGLVPSATVPQTEQTITNKLNINQVEEMTAFKNTIVGKALGKGVNLTKNIAQVVTSPNPVQQAAASLSSGVASAKKEAVQEQAAAQSAAKSRSMTQGSTSESVPMWKQSKTIIGLTFPLWIWGLIIVAILYLVYHFFFRKKTTSSGRRIRRSSSGSMRARMARVRSFRKKRK